MIYYKGPPSYDKVRLPRMCGMIRIAHGYLRARKALRFLLAGGAPCHLVCFECGCNTLW